MADISDKVSVYNQSGRVKLRKIQNMGRYIITRFVLVTLLTIVWYFAYKHYDCELILPSPLATLKAFYTAVTSLDILTNLAITLVRVLKGFGYAMVIGVPLGLLMGSFKTANEIIEGFIDSLRQVPIMAWVPLTIVWFGLGDGPTIFLIAFAGVFPIILNTIQGVHNISKDYYYAARSMGANSFSIFIHVIIPAAIPDILTGARIAISSGWMSVI